MLTETIKQTNSCLSYSVTIFGINTQTALSLKLLHSRSQKLAIQSLLQMVKHSNSCKEHTQQIQLHNGSPFHSLLITSIQILDDAIGIVQ